MKYLSFICCLVAMACDAIDNNPVVETATVYPTVPAVTVYATDSLLSLQNGVWFYRKQPFSGTIAHYFGSGRLKSRQGFYNGKEEGYQYTYYENGAQDTKRFYHHGEKDSINRGWWPNGNPRFEYHFKNGVYEGDFREWYENGQALKHIVFQAGKEQKGMGWRINGKPYMSFEVRNGRLYGLVNPNLCYSLKNERGEYVRTTE